MLMQGPYIYPPYLYLSFAWDSFNRYKVLDESFCLKYVNIFNKAMTTAKLYRLTLIRDLLSRIRGHECNSNNYMS